jgi:hypothetical protein
LSGNVFAVTGHETAFPLRTYSFEFLVTGLTSISCAVPLEFTACVDFLARVTALQDPTNLLQGSARVQQLLRGGYVFNRRATDSNALPNVGEYSHVFEIYTLHANADGTTFATDPAAVNMLLQVIDGSPDEYRVHSINNLPLPTGASVSLFEWRLTQPNGSALSSDDLPPGAPDLAAWAGNELRIGGSDPANPTRQYLLTATVTTTSTVNCTSGGNVVDVLPSGGPAPLVLAGPNPFGGTVRFRFAAQPWSGRVLRIYGADGRRVRMLLGIEKAPGLFEAVWDGTDEHRRPVARGAYFYRLGDEQAVRGAVVYLGR